MIRRSCLPLRFDPAPLIAEADALPGDAWIPHFNTGYYEGEWSGVPLRAVDGGHQALYSDPAAGAAFVDTPALQRSPALLAVLGRFECELLSVRLLRLGPGATIREHRDVNLAEQAGEVRLHVPLTTNPDVEFRHDGQTVAMAPGECWYMDLTLPHAVANRGTSPRIHLVIDAVLNEWLGVRLRDGTAVEHTAPLPEEPAHGDGDGILGMPALERLRRSIVGEGGRPRAPLSPEDFIRTRAALDVLGIGLEPIHSFLYRAMPSAEEMQAWILDQRGAPPASARIQRANRLAAGESPSQAEAEYQRRLAEATPVLSGAELAFWDEHGYVIVGSAAPRAVCERLAEAVWAHAGADPLEPSGWPAAKLGRGGTVALFGGEEVDQLQASPRIQKTFAQLLGTADHVMAADRCCLILPGCPARELALDLEELTPPVQAGVRGMLYLTDASAEGGAVELVPAFHREIDAWLTRLGSYPHAEDFRSLARVPIPGNAGDLVVWSTALPSAAGANASAAPMLGRFLSSYPAPRATRS